jgi:hypothetical protein
VDQFTSFPIYQSTNVPISQFTNPFQMQLCRSSYLLETQILVKPARGGIVGVDLEEGILPTMLSSQVNGCLHQMMGDAPSLTIGANGYVADQPAAGIGVGPAHVDVADDAAFFHPDEAPEALVKLRTGAIQQPEEGPKVAHDFQLAQGLSAWAGQIPAKRFIH